MIFVSIYSSGLLCRPMPDFSSHISVYTLHINQWTLHMLLQMYIANCILQIANCTLHIATFKLYNAMREVGNLDVPQQGVLLSLLGSENLMENSKSNYQNWNRIWPQNDIYWENHILNISRWQSFHKRANGKFRPTEKLWNSGNAMIAKYAAALTSWFMNL